jgi:hypothetical protein
MKTQRGRKLTAPTLACLRSAVSNGSALFVGVDHRSAWMRRLRDLFAEHISDLGGEDALSAAERALVRRCAMLTLQLELMESRWNENNGEAAPRALETYQRTVGALTVDELRAVELALLRLLPRNAEIDYHVRLLEDMQRFRARPKPRPRCKRRTTPGLGGTVERAGPSQPLVAPASASPASLGAS